MTAPEKKNGKPPAAESGHVPTLMLPPRCRKGKKKEEASKSKKNKRSKE